MCQLGRLSAGLCCSPFMRRLGPPLTQAQLADLLGRTTGGLRYSLSYPPDHQTCALKASGRRIGRRVYYPATEVAAIIAGMPAS